MKYFLDEDLPTAVAEIARGHGLDVVKVHELPGRRGRSDGEQLAYAAALGQTLVTRNRDDFLAITLRAFQALQPHRGVLIVPRSLPNHQPRAIAAALGDWHRLAQETDLDPSYCFAFLRARRHQ